MTVQQLKKQLDLYNDNLPVVTDVNGTILEIENISKLKVSYKAPLYNKLSLTSIDNALVIYIGNIGNTDHSHEYCL